MQSHTVEIDASEHPPRLRFSADFNVAVPFIDRHIAEGRSAKIAIRSVDGDVTYADLAANVNRCARLLLRLGLKRGDRMLMVVKDCPAFFYLFWGAIKAGIIPVPLNTLLRATSYTYMIEDSGAAALVYSPEFAEEVRPAIAGAARAPQIVLCTEGEANSFASLIADAGAQFETVATAADDDCFWLYSSGSTGSPKAAVHRHRDMVVTSQRFGVETLGIREDDVFYSEAKLFFAYGLGNNLTFPLWVGATAVLNGARPGPATSFPLIAQFRPTLYFGVPTLYAAYLQHFATEKPDLSSVRHCVSAGEALPAEILRRWHEETGLWILDGIGSTEALHIFISNAPGDIRPGSSGRVVPGYTARILDERGAEVADGDSGQLLISGDSTARCYWNNAERTARTMVDGWLNTGDTYRRDAEGYYYYCGRSDDMMKVGGIWCSPFEIESRLVEHPAVVEAAVVGRADREDLVKPEAFVVLRQGQAGSAGLAAELVDFCRKGLAPYKYPRQINFVAELPKTATGKIQRFVLRSACKDEPSTFGAP
ncbi:benzoate-CoA ligase family protein [Bradyrhizobium sp.]|uniref:benzoate-CoA ligase family protein n=1 Tax=Bradyrhizobium sp. TaxID=376 RepID=UPI00239E970C|nr:benzoate-CoA ligase family protein [Bradyrhizobium sp.]MDE2376062.1 benzoate-CoA ligase family protein [Bradyrhizobium sp.]